MAAPGEYDAEAVAALAKAWIDGVNSATGISGGWRLQVLRMRTRRRFRGGSAEPGPVLDANGEPVSSTGAASGAGCDEYPVRIRRFVQGCPWALVDAAIRYLHSIAPYTGIVYNGVRLAGSYRPTKTEWLRDGQALVAERQVDATYTLYQDLLEITECDDSLSLASGASCSAYEETTYRWDADSVEPVPLECEQGVTWSVRAVQRNEDGTFDYQLVKSVARSRHFGPVLVSCDSMSRVTEETWESLYGDPDSGSLRGEGCDFSGSVPLDGACSPVPGVRVQLQWRRNPDCTYDVTRRVAESSPALDSWREGASCRPVDVVQARNARDLPAVPVPAPGESVDRRLTLNEDGTYDYVDTVRRAPDPYSLSWTDGSSCRRRDVEVLGAQPSMPQPPAVPDRGRLEATVRRNDDCTWDARFETVRAPDPFVAEWVEGSACRPERVRVAEGEAAPPSVPAPGPGETVAANVSRDADCTFSSRVAVRSAPSAFSASWEEGTPCRPSETTVYDGWAGLPPVPALAKGRTVQASLRRESDCTYSGSVSVATQTGDSASWREGSPCRPVDVTETWGAETVDIPAAGEGEAVSASVQRNPDCTYDVRVRTVHAATGDAGSWTEGTACRPVTTTLHESVKALPPVPSPSPGRTVQANFRRNDDCTYSGSVSVATQAEDSASWREGSSCRPVDVTEKWGVKSVEVPGAGEGDTVSASVQRNPDCTYDVRVRTVHAATGDAGSWTEGTACRPVTTTLHESVKALPPVPSPSPGRTVQANFRRNDDCTYSGSVSVATQAEDSASWREGSSCRPVDVTEKWGVKSVEVPGAGEGDTVSASVQRNPDCTYDVRVRTVHAATGDAGSWTEGTACRPVTTTLHESVKALPAVPAPAPGQTVQANFRRNDDCTYSGSVSVATSVESAVSWSEGSCCRPSTVTMSTGLRALPPSPVPGCGTVVSQRVSRNNDCTYDMTREVMTPRPEQHSYTWSSGGKRVHLVKYYNQQAPYILSSADKNAVVNNDFHRNEACLYDGTASEVVPVDDGGGSSHTDGYTWGPNISEAVAMEYHVTPGQDRQQTGFHWTVKVGWAVEGAQKLKAYSSMRANWATGGGAGCAIEGLSTHGGYGRDEIMFSFMAVKVVQTDRISRNLRGSQLAAAINTYVKNNVVGPTKGGLGT